MDLGIGRRGGSWTQSPADTEEQLSFVAVKSYTQIFDCWGCWYPQPPHHSKVNCIRKTRTNASDIISKIDLNKKSIYIFKNVTIQ